VPLIVRDPRREPAENETDLVNLVDIAPTLLDLAGEGQPNHMQGQSMRSLMEGESELPERDATFIETGPMIAIRTRTHLYGVHYDEEKREVVGGQEWFYDLRMDPYELNNLADTEGQVELRSQLRRRLLDWNASTPWLDAPGAVRIVD
jgi:arylsulfatase A-like enzyme